MRFKVIMLGAAVAIALGCTKENINVPKDRVLSRGEIPSFDSDILFNLESNRVATEELSFVQWTDGHYNVRWGDVKGRKALPSNRPFAGEAGIVHLWELEWFSSLETIQDYEFFNCQGLRVVVLPPSVRSVGDQAFHNCASMDSLYIRGTEPPVLGADVFDIRVPVIVVPKGAKKAYMEASCWKGYIGSVEEEK